MAIRLPGLEQPDRRLDPLAGRRILEIGAAVGETHRLDATQDVCAMLERDDVADQKESHAAGSRA
jgi:hypothetical protein